MAKKTLFSTILICFVFSLGILSVSAKSTAATATTTATSTIKTKPIYDATCIKNAIAKREAAIISAHYEFASSTATILGVRKTELQAAWDKANRFERLKGIRAAWKNYNKSRIQARKTLNQKINSAWKTYNQERKSCKASYFDDTNSSSSDTL